MGPRIGGEISACCFKFLLLAIMTALFDFAGGTKRNIAEERDYLGHTGDKLWFLGCDLPSQLTLRFPNNEKFECRSVYVYDTKQQNGIPLLGEAVEIAREAVQKLRYSQGVNSRLMKWPEGHLPNVAVIGGTYVVSVGARAVAFVVRQEGAEGKSKRRYLIAYVY